MAETRLTEHVWQGEDGRLEWQVAPGGFTYRQGDTAGWDAACELTQALHAERERVGKLRADLETIADVEYGPGDAVAMRILAQDALREDGEDRDE